VLREDEGSAPVEAEVRAGLDGRHDVAVGVEPAAPAAASAAATAAPGLYGLLELLPLLR
jgi:hypothetical protein